LFDAHAPTRRRAANPAAAAVLFISFLIVTPEGSFVVFL
jgi:hypothetical protein